jgi:hypothetical protein
MARQPQASLHFASDVTGACHCICTVPRCAQRVISGLPARSLKFSVFLTKKQVIFSGLMGHVDMAGLFTGRRPALVRVACCFTFPLFSFSDESSTNEI